MAHVYFMEHRVGGEGLGKPPTERPSTAPSKLGCVCGCVDESSACA
jgi:hypothetical protein